MILYHSYDTDVQNKNGIWLSETPQNEYGEKICSFIVDENKLKIADFKTTIKYILNYDLKNINDIIENEDECVAHCVGTDEIINYLDDGIPENEIFETVKQKAFDTNSISYVIFMEVMMHPFYHNFYKYMQKDNYDGYSFPFEYDPSDNYYFIFYPEKINKQINKKQNTMKIKLTESQLKQIVNESVRNVLSEMDWRTYSNAARKAAHLAATAEDEKEKQRRNNQRRNFHDKAGKMYRKQYGLQDYDFEESQAPQDVLDRVSKRKHDAENFYLGNQEYRNGKWQNK